MRKVVDADCGDASVSVTETVTLYLPIVVGVPVITPPALMLSPGGRLLAENL